MEHLAKADFMLVSDTGIPNTDQIVITTALRGLVDLEIKLRGPKSDLPPGIHGGAVYNPTKPSWKFAPLCTTLMDQ